MVFSYTWSESQIHMLVLYVFSVDRQVFLCREEERENGNNFFRVWKGVPSIPEIPLLPEACLCWGHRGCLQMWRGVHFYVTYNQLGKKCKKCII